MASVFTHGYTNLYIHLIHITQTNAKQSDALHTNIKVLCVCARVHMYISTILGYSRSLK